MAKDKKKDKREKAATKKKGLTKDIDDKNALSAGRGVLDHAVITGNLVSRPDGRDVKVDAFSVSLHGKELIQDAVLELNYGRRYGLIGRNGSGKSTLLSAIGYREVPVPEHINIWHHHKESDPSDRTAMESVIDVVREEWERLEKESEKLLEEDPESQILADIYEKLDKLDPDTFEQRAGVLLVGLGFTHSMMHRATKDMSGGWRMRVALAQALFVEPHLLLMDEPTNHLDLGACVWLEDYLAKYDKGILVLISHSADFLDNVCTNTIHLTVDGKFNYYGGGYSIYCRTRAENETNQMKRYQKEQDDIKHIKEFISSCGTYANMVKQAQSKQKIIDKMVEAGLTTKPKPDPMYRFRFPDADKIPPPVLSFADVSFSYSGKVEDYLYEKLDFGCDMDSRVALVGPNGAGKSTLIKLMVGELEASEGTIGRNGHLRIGRYNQHSEEVLDMNKSPLEFFSELYPKGIITRNGLQKMEVEDWRSKIGQFGVTGVYQTRPMKTMSDGYHTRVVFCLMALQNPHMLLLDEPTNHLDMECIDSLAEAINNFDGGVVLVSHDFRLISQVAEDIWVCENKTVQPWKHGIQAYKEHLRKIMMATT